MELQPDTAKTPCQQLAESSTDFREILRMGDPCPQCGQGKLDYNGLLELECPRCGYRYLAAGSYT
jgi:uncharacterized protein (DUF983 family)